jgi:hypothetical protein
MCVLCIHTYILTKVSLRISDVHMPQTHAYTHIYTHKRSSQIHKVGERLANEYKKQRLLQHFGRSSANDVCPDPIDKTQPEKIAPSIDCSYELLHRENFREMMTKYELHECKKRHRKGQLVEFHRILAKFNLRAHRVPDTPAKDHLFKFYAKVLGKSGTNEDCASLRKLAITEALNAEDLMKDMGFRNVLEDYCR